MKTAFIQTHDRDDRAIATWLVLVAFLVFTMILVGGATRLTQSGLSIVDWKPISGIIPPLNEAEWLAEFEGYKQFPEYKLINHGMSLDEFKGIFYWEYSHRLLGRLIGLAFAVPMLFFFIRKKVKSALKPKLIGLFILGGMQGVMGWYMVMSGLIHEPEVSHLRLTAHLSLAIAIIMALCWVAWGLYRPQKLGREVAISSGFRRFAGFLLIAVLLQMIMGALVAGLKAGFAFNTWPLMADKFIPDHLYPINPFWHSMLDDTMTVQFDHRMGAYTIFALVMGLMFYVYRHNLHPRIKFAAHMLAGLVLVQIVLGVLTLIHVVPVTLGVAHQGIGVMVTMAALFLVHEVRR